MTSIKQTFSVFSPVFTGLKPQNWKSPKQLVSPIDQFWYIEIQPDTIDLNTKLWEINPTNSVVIP